jgi:hypothetical protein
LAQRGAARTRAGRNEGLIDPGACIGATEAPSDSSGPFGKSLEWFFAPERPAETRSMLRRFCSRRWSTMTSVMLNRPLLVLLGLLAATAACEDEKKTAELQRKADERIAKIQGEAAEKVAAAEKKVAELQDQLVEAGAAVKAEAEEEVSKAKSEADKLAAEAASALKKARAAYKENERRELAALQKEIDEARAKAQSAPPKVKAQFDQAMKDIAAKKEVVRKDIDAIDTSNLETLRTAKAKADVALAQLKQAIHSAKSKIP